jgi:hypothetical protein
MSQALSMLSISRHPIGPRVQLLGARVHHGALGALLAAAGVFLMVRDWRERPWHRDR